MCAIVSKNYTKLQYHQAENPGVRHQIRLEFSDVHVQSSIEAQRCLNATPVVVGDNQNASNTPLSPVRLIQQETVKEEMICAINLFRLV